MFILLGLLCIVETLDIKTTSNPTHFQSFVSHSRNVTQYLYMDRTVYIFVVELKQMCQNCFGKLSQLVTCQFGVLVLLVGARFNCIKLLNQFQFINLLSYLCLNCITCFCDCQQNLLIVNYVSLQSLSTLLILCFVEIILSQELVIVKNL